MNFCYKRPSSPHIDIYNQAFTELFLAIPDAVIYEDLNRVVRNVNPAFKRIFGYEPDEIIGEKSDKLYPGPIALHEHSCLESSMGDADRPYELMCFRRKTGKTFNAMGICTAVRNSTGEVQGFLRLLRDNTENELKGSESTRLTTAVEQATENIIITDPAGNIQYVNPSFEKNTGYSKTEVMGKTPSMLKSGAHDDDFYKKIWTTLNSGRPWSGRIKNRRKCGSYFIEDCIITPVLSESGEIINFVGVKHDVTRTIELEEQFQHSQRVESLGRLAGGVAHDINNLLFPITLHAEDMLDEMSGTCEYREPLEEILKGGLKINDMVSRLLAFGSKQEFEMVPLDLNRVVMDFQKLLRKAIREDVEISFCLDPAGPIVMANEAQLWQIIMNLAVNAQHAMPDGGHLIIQTGTCPKYCFKGCCNTHCKGFPLAFIQVSDTGQGMDDKTMGHIFEPFFTTRDNGHGSGLGLASVYGIVRQHNGHIDVKSEPGLGSRFSVGLPIYKSSKEYNCTHFPKKNNCRRGLGRQNNVR